MILNGLAPTTIDFFSSFFIVTSDLLLFSKLVLFITALLVMSGIRSFLRNHVGPFVRKTKGTPITTHQPPHFYLGNEAADADSIISSLCYAYHEFNCAIDKEVFHVPVVAIDRKELHLRRDVELLLNKVDLQLADLVCLDEIHSLKSDNNNKESCVTLTLLDHNALSQKVLSALPSRSVVVCEILDHHIDMKQHNECAGPMRNIAFNSATNVAEVASTCTLVFEKFHATAQDTKNSFPFEPEVATLLLGVILLDSLNMSPQAGKGTSRDGSALNHLRQITSMSNMETDKMFNELSNAKTDIAFWNNLSAEDCLLLDYKLFQARNKMNTNFNIGMSSVLLPIERFLFFKDDVLKACDYYLTECECDVLVIMSMVTEPEMKREMVIVSKSEGLVSDLVSRLEHNINLQVTPLTFETHTESEVKELVDSFKINDMYFSVVLQGNVKASRKQVAPLISAYFEQTSSSR